MHQSRAAPEMVQIGPLYTINPAKVMISDPQIIKNRPENACFDI